MPVHADTPLATQKLVDTSVTMYHQAILTESELLLPPLFLPSSSYKDRNKDQKYKWMSAPPSPVYFTCF